MSQIYTVDCQLYTLNERYKNKKIFRKMTNSEIEIKIYKILKNNPHSNIVEIYKIGKNHIDLEFLDTYIPLNYNNFYKIESLKKVKEHLQSLGIVYIDWKDDQYGIGENGILKLFDFDGSGIFDINTNKWIDSPNHFYNYLSAVKKGITNPIKIDNHNFRKNILKEKKCYCLCM